MKNKRVQEIARLIYENKMSNELGIIAGKHQNGLDVEADIEKFAEKISTTKEEIKEFFKICFREFKNLT